MIFVLFYCFWGCQSQVIDVRASMTWLVMCTAQWNIVILTKVRLELVNSFLSNYYWACMHALNHKEESSKGIEQAHWRVVPLQRHTRSHTNAESWTHARAILCTHALSHMTRKARIKRGLNFEKAIDLFEIKKQRNNANFIFARVCSTARRLHAKFSFRDSEINRNQARPAIDTNSDPILYYAAHPPQLNSCAYIRTS